MGRAVAALTFNILQHLFTLRALQQENLALQKENAVLKLESLEPEFT